MICPKCLAAGGLKQTVHIIVECPGDQMALDKTAIRKREVKILGVDWGKAQYFCSECEYVEGINNEQNTHKI